MNVLQLLKQCLLLLQTFVKGYLITLVRLLLGIDAEENSGHLSSVRYFNCACCEPDHLIVEVMSSRHIILSSDG